MPDNSRMIGVVERQVEGIEDLDALRRPDAAGELGTGDLMHLVGVEAGVEEGPEPGDEEHHLGGDEHDHAVAQVQRHDAGVVALMRFLDRIRPPGEHGVEHDQHADCEDEVAGAGKLQPEEMQAAALHVLHPGHTTDRGQQGADRAEERPRTRVDDVIVVMRFRVCVCHVSPRDFRRQFQSCFRRLPSWRPPASPHRSGRRYRKA